MNVIEAIAAKRDGQENTQGQLVELAHGAATGSIPDYQLSAWLMAAYLNGLNPRETSDLTIAIVESGERLDLNGLPKPWLDKHSTGGVGDKTTLVVLPILAACGVTMVKMSGRGLGITGGTIDKLESVPGFRTDLTPEEMVAQAKRTGIALSGQTSRLAPADGALYALRDVTGTVASIPLITASILSKKIAGGAETVVLDVKCGSGAFMTTLADAEALARSLVDIGKLCGLRVSAVITDMDQPLGMAAGNANEVVEALHVLSSGYEFLKGEPRFSDELARFSHLCVELAGHALEVVGKGDRATALEALSSGRAHAKAIEWMVAQGADAEVIAGEDWARPKASRSIEHDGAEGYLNSIRADLVGQAVIALGGGRVKKSDVIDPTAGVMVLHAVGHRVEAQQTVFSVSCADESRFALAVELLKSAYSVGSEPVAPRDPVLKLVH